MSANLKGTMNVEQGVFTIEQLNETCRYGSKSYPSAILIAEYASEHPLVKTFKLEGTDIEFDSSLATPTIGTKITMGNKVANGVDPNFRESTGGGGGGSRTKLSARVDGKELVINDGTADAKISADAIVLPVTASNAFAAKVAEVSRKAREGNFDLVKSMVGKPHLMARVAGIAVDTGECDEITAETKANAIATLAGEIQKLGKLELFAKLGESKFELVGGEVESIVEWAKAHLPAPAVEAKAEPAK